MKKKLLFLYLLLIVFNLDIFSQIKTNSSYNPKQLDISIPYDSTVNYVREKYFQYIGQTLYYPKSTYDHGRYGIEGFNTKPKTGSTYKKKYPNQTNPEFIKGKYFQVIDTVNTQFYGKKYIFLKLKEKEKGDIIYYHYHLNSNYDSSFPFFVVGYFERMKHSLIGQYFPLLPSSTITYKYIGTDEFADNRLLFNENKNYVEWQCTDYFIDEGIAPREMVILEDSTGKKISMSLNNLIEETEFALKADFNIKKEISRIKGINKLVFGMSKSECESLCGKPNKKNITYNSIRNHEQWVYDDSYLYFENDRLVSIQQSE